MNRSGVLLLGTGLAASILLCGSLVSSRVFGPNRGLEGNQAQSPREAGDPAEVADSGALGTFPMLETASPADVREVVRFCRDAGRGDLAGLRFAALTSPDPLVVGNALGALGLLRAVAGDRELCALLGDPRLRVRQELVVALGKSGDPSVVELLTPCLERSEPQLRPLVIQALGRLDCADARAALEGYATVATEQEQVFLRAALSPPVTLRVDRTRISSHEQGGRTPVEGDE